MIFFSARDASLSHKEQSIEVDTARGILPFWNPPRLDHFKFLFGSLGPDSVDAIGTVGA